MNDEEKRSLFKAWLSKKGSQLKEFLTHRWALCIALVFNFVLPLVVIGVKVFTINAEMLTPTVSVSFGGMIVGIIYFAFIAKKVKRKVEDMEQGVSKIFLTGVQGILPFVVAAFVFKVIEKALQGASTTAWIVAALLAMGSLWQMFDWSLNKEYLYAKEIDKLARQQAEIELRKEQLIRQSQEESEI